MSGVIFDPLLGQLRTSDAGGASPLTTKGDIYGYSTTNARIPVGADGTVLTADSTQTTGVKWNAVSGTGTVTSVSVTTANGVSGSVANATTTPAVTLTLGAITPTSVNSVVVSGSSTPTLAVTGTSSISGANTGDQTITLTGAVTGSGTGSFATTLATPGTLTVSSTNSNVTAHTHAITSSSAPGAAASLLATDSSGIIGSTGTRIVKGWFTDLTVTNAIAGSITGNAATVTTNANLTGVITSSGNATSIASQTGTGTKFVVDASPALTGSPTAPTQTPADNSTKIATTAYVDNAVLGQNFKEAVGAATTANLVGTYLNGASGVGATFTYTATGVDTIDGIVLTLGMRILLKNQTTAFQNGIYTVTTAGAIGVAGILTRATDADQTTDWKTGDSTFVTAGTTLSTTTWAYTGVDSPTMGSTSLTFAQTAGQGAFTAGNGIAITGNSIAIDTSVTVDKTTAQTLSSKTLTSPVISTIVNTGTLTLPTATDTLVGRATTDTLTNKTFDSTSPTAFFYPGMIMPYVAYTAPTGWLFTYGQAISRATYSALFTAIVPTIGTFTVTIATPAVATLSAHPFRTGDQVYLTTSGALPTGLTANTIYYVHVIDANTFHFSTTQANAFAATYIATSGSQSGTQTIVYCPYGLGDGSTTFNIPDLRGNVPAGKDDMGGTAANRLNLNTTQGVRGYNLGNSGGEQSHQLVTAELASHTHNLTFVSGTGVTGNIPLGSTPGSTFGGATSSAGSDTTHNNVQPTLILNYIIKT